MGMKKGIFLLSVSTGLVIVFLSLTGFINLRRRPGIPEPYAANTIVRVNSYVVRDVRDLDFIFSRKKIGDPVEIELKTAGQTKVARTVLGSYYPQPPWIFLLIGGSAFLIGFAVFFLRPEDRRARIFYCATLAFGSAVMISGELYGVHDKGLSLVPGILFNFAYPLAPALLLRFCRTFSPGREKIRSVLFWALPVAFGAGLNFGFLASQLRPSFSVYRVTQNWLFLFRWYVVVACLAAVAELVRSFRASVSDEVRAQIKWIFFGMSVGLSPFIFLYQIPITLWGNGRELVSEDFSSVFMLLVPLTLAVAILKYRLMNVKVVINRSLVYSLLTMFTVGVYLVSADVLGHLFARESFVRGNWISLGAAVLAAVVFQPGRKRIQLLVDKTFFRQDYDYRRAVLSFSARSQKIMASGNLVSQFAAAVGEALPLEKIGVVVHESGEDGPRLLLGEGMDETSARAFLSGQAPSGDAWARDEAVRATPGVDFSKQELLKALGWEVVLPLPFESGEMAGCLALGRKKSELRFTAEDIDLVKTLAWELALGLRRIRLQEEVIYERASREKADELNRMKTEFVSSVSHELRTPMGALQSLSELLGSGRIKDETRRERLLQLMAGECSRLSRFIHNVLDFGKIEQETKVYDMRPAAVQPIIREVMDLCRSGTTGEDLVLKAEMPAEPEVFLEADEDAVRQALLNLIDNAIKYSEGRKDVTVRLVPGSESVEIQVEDRGVGIKPEDREKIFEAFFRSSGAARHNPKGVGLGLKIVKHIMDAHGGQVGFRSEPGKGTTFSLIFPRRRLA
jgi:signal transduction histidine kinase